MIEQQARKTSFRWPLVVLAVALVLNVVFAFVIGGRGSGAFFTPTSTRVGSDIFAVVPLEGQQVLMVTLGSEITIQEKGKVLARAQAPAAVGDVVYASATKEILVGTYTGKLLSYDLSLKQTNETTIRGRILRLALTPSGNVVVGHGIGASGDRFYVSLVDAKRQVISTYQVGVPLSAVGSLGENMVYGTEQAHVGVADPAGNPLWQVQLKRSILAMRGWQQKRRILVGDEAGNVAMLDEAGNTLWSVNVTQFRVSTIVLLNDNLIAIGDYEGGLMLLDSTGKKLLELVSQGSEVIKDRVQAIYPTGDGTFTAVRQSGQVILLDPRSLGGAQWIKLLRPIWYVGDAVLFALLIATTIDAVERWRRPTIRLFRSIYRARTAYFFLLPSFLLIAVFSYLATGMAIYYSGTDYVPGDPIRFIGFRNFTNIFTADRFFWIGFGNMILIVVTSVIKVLTMPLGVALLIFHLRSPKLQYYFRTAVIVPSVVPGIVLTMMWKMMYDPGTTGFFNAVLRSLGLQQWTHAWLGEPQLALWAIIFSGFPWVGAFSLLIYLGGLININPELFDAAAIDGVGWWGRLRYVEWPLIAPQRNLLLFFTYLGAIQGYASIWIYTQGGPGAATYVPALQLYLNLSAGMRVGYASAIGFVLFVMVLLVTIVNRTLQRRTAI